MFESQDFSSVPLCTARSFYKAKKRNQKLLSNSQEMFTNRTPNSQGSSFYQSCFHQPSQLCLRLSVHVTSIRLSTAPGPGPVSTHLKHQVGSSCPQRGAWEGRLQCTLRATGWAQARDVPGKWHQNRVRPQGPPPGPGVSQDPGCPGITCVLLWALP